MLTLCNGSREGGGFVISPIRKTMMESWITFLSGESQG